MRTYELSPRLASVAEQIPQGARLADIGTDHAYLPVWLLLQGRLSGVIAADLRGGPLERARQTAARYGVAERISFRLCDGLSGIRPEEVDTITIAGMGGETIAEILAAAPWTGKGDYRLLLQPMTAHAELRHWLNGHGFRIASERLTREGRTLYATLCVLPGWEPPLTPAESWAGRQQAGEAAPLRGEYLERLLHRSKHALEGLRRSSREGDRARLVELEKAAQGLAQMKEEWELWQR